ncbi:MAG: hypothetical protein ACTS44_00545 [Candidatus Hodgkinia cicadicola]
MSELTTVEYIKLLKQLTWRQRYVGRRLKLQLGNARGLGDFSENAELQIARAEAKVNDVKVERLRRLVGEAEVINLKSSRGRIGFNTLAILRGSEGRLGTLSLLGSSNVTWELNHVEVPLEGVQCVGRKVGDVIMLPRGNRREPYKVICIAGV